MEFNPLFLNINNQISGAGNSKPNRFGNLSYLFKDIIKVKMDGAAGDSTMQAANFENQTGQSQTNVSQISISEVELKKIIENLLSKFGNLTGELNEVNKNKSSKSKKNKDGNDEAIDLNNLISQLEAGKTVKLNFTGTDENYSLEISKSSDNGETVNSSSNPNETVDTSVLNIQSPKLLFALKNLAAANSQEFNPKIENAEVKQALNNAGGNITSNDILNPLADSNSTQNGVEQMFSKLEIDPNNNILNNTEATKASTSGNVKNINLNGSQAENLFKELKSLIENRDGQLDPISKTDEINFKIKIVKENNSDSQFQSADIKAADKSSSQSKVINGVNNDEEKLFQVNQKLHTEAQKGFKELENQNNKFSKINISSSNEEMKEVINKSGNNTSASAKAAFENPTQNVKTDINAVSDNLKILSSKGEVEIKYKSDLVSNEKLPGNNFTTNNSSQIKDTIDISDKIISDSKFKDNSILKTLNPEVKSQDSIKTQDVKEIKSDTAAKNAQQSDIKVAVDNKDQTAVKSQDVKEAKSDSVLKNIQNSNPKAQSNFNQQTSDQGNKDAKPSIVIKNSSEKNNSSKEVKPDISSDKIDSQKTTDSQFNSELKSTQNSDVKENKVPQQFNNQPKIIKPSQILNEISSFIKKGEVKSLVLKLTPENLGKVKVEVNMVDSVMHANIEVENESVKQTIQTNFNQLRTALTQSGITVAGLTISLNNGGEKNTKASEPKRKTSVGSQAIKTEEQSMVTIPKKMGYNTYEYLA